MSVGTQVNTSTTTIQARTLLETSLEHSWLCHLHRADERNKPQNNVYS